MCVWGRGVFEVCVCGGGGGGLCTMCKVYVRCVYEGCVRCVCLRCVRKVFGVCLEYVAYYRY